MVRIKRLARRVLYHAAFAHALATAVLLFPLQRVLAGETQQVDQGAAEPTEQSLDGVAEPWPSPLAGGARLASFLRGQSEIYNDVMELVDGFGSGNDYVEGPFVHIGNMYIQQASTPAGNPGHAEYTLDVYVWSAELGMISEGTVELAVDRATGQMHQVLTMQRQGVTRVLDSTATVAASGIARVSATLTVDTGRAVSTYEGGYTYDGEWYADDDCDPAFVEGADEMVEDFSDCIRACTFSVVVAVVVVVVVAVGILCYMFCWMLWVQDMSPARDTFQQRLERLTRSPAPATALT